MALSVLWSVYAGALAAIGFVRRSASVRWASLALFGLTIIKVMLVDIAALHQFYRIIAFLCSACCCSWWPGVTTKLFTRGRLDLVFALLLRFTVIVVA